jgi:hypothetical protein
MVKKDYTRIAFVINQMPLKLTKEQLVNELSLLFLLDNPKFKKDLFVKACFIPKETTP